MFPQDKIDSLKIRLNNTANKEKKLAILDTLTKEMLRHEHEDVAENLRAYITLAKVLKAYDLMASKSRFLIQIDIMKGNNKGAIALCDSMLSFQDFFKKNASKAHILLKRGGVYFSELDYKRAIQDYNIAAELFLESKPKDSIFAADAYFYCGGAHNNLGNFIEAITHYELAYSIYESQKDYNYMLYCLERLDFLYRVNGLGELANNNLPELIRKSKAYKAYGSLAFLYVSKAEQNIEANDLQQAQKDLDSVKKYIAFEKDSMNKKSKQVDYLVLLLRLHLKANNILAADTILKKINLLEKDFQHKEIIYGISTYKAAYFIKKNDYPKALKILLDYEKYASSNSNKNLELLTVEKLLSQTYKSMGNYSQALMHNNRYVALKDSIHRMSLTNAIAYHETNFKTLLKEKEITNQKIEIQNLEAENLKFESRRKNLIFVIYSIFALGFGLWWNQRAKKRHLKKELSRFTTQLLEKSKEQEALRIQLEKLKNFSNTDDAINNIDDLMESKILTKEDWYNFRKKFRRVYPSFFNSMKSYNLTNSEERIVVLEKLGLENSQIANMLGVSVESIFTYRYRLRKKLDISSETGISNYIEKT